MPLFNLIFNNTNMKNNNINRQTIVPLYLIMQVKINIEFIRTTYINLVYIVEIIKLIIKVM